MHPMPKPSMIYLGVMLTTSSVAGSGPEPQRLGLTPQVRPSNEIEDRQSPSFISPQPAAPR